MSLLIKPAAGGITKLSELDIDAALAMGAHPITLGAGQTVDGYDLSEGFTQYELGDIDAVISATIVSNNTLTPTKVKEMKITTLLPAPSTIRTYFGLRSAAGFSTAYAQIYKNGSPVGTLRGTTSTSYQYYSQDLEFTTNNLLQLYMYGSTADGAEYNSLCEKFGIRGSQLSIIALRAFITLE